MSRPLLNLIKGDVVKLDPGVKIIPAQTLAKLINAKELIEEVKADALQYREKVAVETEEIKQNGYLKGYEDGFAAWAEELLKLEKEIALINSKVRDLILPIALKAAQKIVGREIAENKETIIDIISTNIKSVAQHKKVVIFVNKDEWEYIDQNKQQIKSKFEDLQSLSIRPRDDIEPHSCVIETENGIVNSQMSHKWHIFENVFSKLKGSFTEKEVSKENEDS